MTTRNSGFTLIELLVVVAIIGILSAIGVTAYSGYVNGAKVKTAENILSQIALGQTEFFANERVFAVTGDLECPATVDTSFDIEERLFGGAGVITEVDAEGDRRSAVDFNFCVDADGDGFEITATSTAINLACELTLNRFNNLTRSAGCT
jgi:prepilin-type N-terminal cleavage/methylation domain-containing protein